MGKGEMWGFRPLEEKKYSACAERVGKQILKIRVAPELCEEITFNKLYSTNYTLPH